MPGEPYVDSSHEGEFQGALPFTYPLLIAGKIHNHN